ncbi:phosphatidylinositol:UDP-GlcNAc transferase PIG-C [Talaromyces proteolyticus]|uniref:Phosphatidylinositol:UDP-GlcNAc transferase PIG-C n=1 Tax=Talaromyces proteolyticus TaxID=1131652 RepID=A0AAD4PUU2_9EURO|nr:phosphatidylinositol:UDP-GlcNAc transferase PIG-C [Talaromyces proteolyticus]KAH8690534.1 phosphatidylinositol:UDP-GlcNAc transferase PIG-C [Talaromyces proteolyticus]
MAPQPQSPPPIPPPVPVETHPNRAGGLKPPLPNRVPPDPTRLAPEHAYYSHSQPRLWHDDSASLRPISGAISTPAAVAALRPPPAVPGTAPRKSDGRKLRDGRRKKRKGAWKKLLWVRQSYPDNYTDAETFLDHLQRNPRLRPYDFWPLVADSTVIVQHVCSVAIFVCCFVGIVHDRVSPVSVVGWGSIGTVLGWVLWDSWVWKEQREALQIATQLSESGEADDGSSASSTSSHHPPSAGSQSNGNAGNVHGLGLNIPRSSSEIRLRRRSTEMSASSLQNGNPNSPILQPTNILYPFNEDGKSLLSTRNRQRLATVKSAALIYCALLGLSPILKSLTKSTASDSIWAMSCWLMIINIFSFDYGSGEGGADVTKFPASLSTNAALMASTVLASRLPSTTHVFSLTLFSIEVFGLFPVFRRHLRQVSWTGHLILTFGLVLVAGAGVGITVRGGWAAAIVGSIMGSILTALAMGSCSWWLISLQKYKNVVIGPWDPARPIIRRNWD